MAVFESKIFHDKTIPLDGNTYKSCEFRRCVLSYRGGALPSFIQCVFVRNRFDYQERREGEERRQIDPS
jgi:hypothetical protein